MGVLLTTMVVALPATEAACFATVIHVHTWTETLLSRVLRARDSLALHRCPLYVVTTGFQLSVEGVTTVDGTETSTLRETYPSITGQLHRKAFGGWKGDRGVLLAYATATAEAPPGPSRPERLRGQVASSPRFYWNIESDVDWKGDLYSILSDWDDRGEDLLCVDHRKTPYDWEHASSHDAGDWMDAKDKHNCLMTIARASAPLLDRVLDVAKSPGHRAYLELRFASECERMRRLHDNCTARELFDSDDRAKRRKGDLFTWTGSKRHRRFNKPSRYKQLFGAAPNGTLWHPVKDDGAWRLQPAPHAGT